MYLSRESLGSFRILRNEHGQRKYTPVLYTEKLSPVMGIRDASMSMKMVCDLTIIILCLIYCVESLPDFLFRWYVQWCSAVGD